MPIDPRSYFINVPQSQGPMDMYRDYMSLRDLMDRRRYNDLQARRLEQQYAEAQRKEQERQTFFDVLRRGGSSAERYQAAPELAIRFETEERARDKADREAKTAALTQQQTQEKLDQSAKERALSELDSIRSVPDPETQGRMFMEWQSKNPRLGRGVTWPLNDRGFEFLGKSVLGPSGYTAYRAAEDKRVQDLTDATHKREVTQPMQDRLLRAQAEHAEQVLTGTAKPSPAAQPALFENWYQGYLQKNNLKDNAMSRYQATEAWIAANRPQFAQPGVDIPKPQAVIDQEVEKARRISEVTSGTKPNAEFNKKMLALKNLRSAIAAYRTELERVGPTFQMGKGARLNSLYRDLQLQQKEAANLGALAGPDQGILEQLMTPPSGLAGNWMGTPALLQQLDVGNEIIGRNEVNLRDVYGQPAAQTPSAPPAAGGGKAATHVFNPRTGKIEAK